MAGTIPLSMTQQFNEYGDPLAGGQLYLIVAGTVSTPQNGFQDPALVTPLPNPITLDAAGRIPQFFLADGLIKVRLQDKHGVVQLSSDNIQVIGPSSGGGGSGGATIDPTTIYQTGDLKPRYGTGNAHTGWVRCNGLTIGSASASPSATERGNADCNALFLHLWGNDASLVVSGGRGANAAADWAANKTIALPDWRGNALGGLDDMGNVAASRLTAAFFGVAATVLGAAGGSESTTLSTTQIPSHTHTGTTATIPDHTHSYGAGLNTVTYAANPGVAQGFAATAQTTGGAGAHAHGFTTDTTGGGQAHRTVGPAKLCTIYIKL